MTPDKLKERTGKFALRIIRATQSLPRGRVSDVLGKQLLRSGTSVGANYRAACRARSKAEFIAKLGIVEEEADETLYWMGLLIEANLVRKELLENLMQEADELLSIIIASINTTRGSKRKARLK